MRKIFKLTRLAERLLKEIERETGLQGRVKINFHSWPNNIGRDKALRIGNGLAAVMDSAAREWQADNTEGVTVNEFGGVEVTLYYSLTIPDLQEAALGKQQLKGRC